MTTYEQTQRRQTIRVLAGAAFASTLFLLAPLRVSYGESKYCASQRRHEPTARHQADYVGTLHTESDTGLYILPSGRIYGYAQEEDARIYRTQHAARICPAYPNNR